MLIEFRHILKGNLHKSSSKLEKKFIDDHVKLYEDARFSDLTISVGEGDGQRSFEAHKNILAMRSEYFQGLFESGMEESRQDLVRMVRLGSN